MAVPTAFPNAFQQPQGERKQKQRRLPPLRKQIAAHCPGLFGAMREVLPGRIPLAGLVDRRSLGRMVASFRESFKSFLWIEFIQQRFKAVNIPDHCAKVPLIKSGVQKLDLILR